MRMAEMSFERETLMTDERKEWIKGVAAMLAKLTIHRDLPIPKMSTENTFVAMVFEPDNNGELLKKLVHVTNQLDGATLEFYNYTEDRLPEMDRLRLMWMFGPIRYELDASVIEVFAGTAHSHAIFTNVNYIGENVNTIIRPVASESS